VRHAVLWDSLNYSFSAVHATSSAPSMRLCSTYGHGSSDNPAVWIDSSHIVIEECEFFSHAGKIIRTIFLENSSGIISGSTIRTGSADTIDGISIGIVLVASSNVTIFNNTIHGGYSPGSGAISCLAGSSDIGIYNNILNAGGDEVDSVWVWGVYNAESSSRVTITNNIIVSEAGANRWAIWEGDAGSVPMSFRNNVIYGFPNAFYYDEADGTLLTTGSDVEANLTNSGMSSDHVSGNQFGIDPQLSSNDYRPSTLSPVEVTSGGLDLSSFFATDKATEVRTVPWSVGAYEID
jgi:hypothetical protein